ncbi:hypothetical protein A3195_17375 [Candidatus Thiodiazotropha endoloripes]|uniref:Flagellar protein FliT n=1 Tax=Candidatus Thiodiazotropha endoloripes TaxID=1818881 RepID=A0A1E2UQ38_9GAMM|nr:hypothetical protein A3195_17375 [Candidatus Thiodiazotropha endoloripes]ODB96868.1 hypothetical protein A3196_08910 [Candidatus Thiodiazotropha endoloripes]
MSQLQKNLTQALELSQRIFDLAQDSAWSDMEQADRQRRPFLESIFNDREFKLKPGDYESQMRQIVALNEQALALCAEARGELSKQGRNLKLGRQALSAYKNNSFD